MVVNGGPAVLLKNEGGDANYWLKVRLAGRLSNRHGLGTKLRVVAGGTAAIREVGAGSSYCSQHAVGEELFGLGASERVDTLQVRWPSGVTQHLSDLAANQTIVVTEELQDGIEAHPGCVQ